MNKKTFSNKWSNIVKHYYIDSNINPFDLQFLYESLSRSKSYNFLNKEGYRLTIRNIEISNGRKIRMLCAIGKISGKVIPVSKSKIVEQLYPTKKRVNKDKVNEHYDILKLACRNEIKDQIIAYRESLQLPLICPLTGEKLTFWGNVHIDHQYPFIKLLTDWLESIDISPIEVALKGSKNNKRIKDDNLSNSWQEYHLKYAVLQAVSCKANLSKGSSYSE